ncbi:MAG: ATPase, T2SS/T4P/T4SS family [Candidatus Taylorbacteria bacterium]
MVIQFDEDKQNKDVDELHKREEEELAELVANQHGLEYSNLSMVPINMDALRIVSEQKARVAKLAPFNLVDKNIQIAVVAPDNTDTEKQVAELETKGFHVTKVVVSMRSLVGAWEKYKDMSFAEETKSGSLEISNAEISELLTKVKTKEEIKKYIQELLAQPKGFRISRILEIILAGAITTGASDIHIEPEEGYVTLRFRLDGVLNTILTFERDTYFLILSRVKLLSGLKLNVKETAQDGRFSVKINDLDIEIRTSTLPGAYSESIVLRVLNPNSISVPLTDLGINAKLLAILEKEIARPNGLILTTGPTGSGKTTTLYAFLKKIHTPDIKIITIEDPIEYHLPGIVQTQTDNDKGYTFLSGLRSALRQDPDIIMVGEIRDSETAEIAINSALTGHLVFSTLHTNNAGGAFPRLIDLGVNPKIFTSAINIAMAQRLVRKLCEFCKKETPLEGQDKIIIEKILASIFDKSYLVPAEKMWVSVGCEKCNNTGYKGRTGVYEAIITDQGIEDVVLSNPSEREIRKAAEHQGILDMKQDGILKVLSGMTSLVELRRVLDLEEDM